MTGKGKQASEIAVSPLPLRKQMEEKLRQAITRGYFEPGAHLSDKMLSEAFQVSRPVVREAVRLLAAEGLIETIPHRGSFVRTLSSTQAAQLYEVRGALEALAAKSFAQVASSEAIARLEAVFATLSAMGPDTPSDRILATKQQFYAIMFEGAQNEHLTAMLHKMLDQNMVLRTTSLSSPGRLPKTVEELGRLMQAIRDRDPEAAWVASLDHVNAAAEAAIAVLRAREAAHSKTE